MQCVGWRLEAYAPTRPFIGRTEAIRLKTKNWTGVLVYRVIHGPATVPGMVGNRATSGRHITRARNLQLLKRSALGGLLAGVLIYCFPALRVTLRAREATACRIFQLNLRGTCSRLKALLMLLLTVVCRCAGYRGLVDFAIDTTAQGPLDLVSHISSVCILVDGLAKMSAIVATVRCLLHVGAHVRLRRTTDAGWVAVSN